MSLFDLEVFDCVVLEVCVHCSLLRLHEHCHRHSNVGMVLLVSLIKSLYQVDLD